jgi:hypothetical protein
MDLLDLLKTLLLQFAVAIPRVIGAIIIAVLGMVIAKAIAKLVVTLLSKAGVDKAAEKLNQMDALREYKIKIVPSAVLSKVLYYIVLLVFLIAATETLGMPAVSKLITDLINYIPNIISSGIVLIIGLVIADAAKSATVTATKSLGIPSGKLISNILFYFILMTMMISALSQAKIDTDFIKSNLNIILAGGVFAFALGYGLSSKDTMANFLASFYSKSKFRIGDYITINGVTGTIVHIDNNSLTLQTDKSYIVLPLSKFTTEIIEIHHGADKKKLEEFL